MPKPRPFQDAKATTWKELRAHQLRNRPTLTERICSKPLKSLGFHRSVALFGYIADFYNPTVKLVIEVDGPYHSEREELDRNRDMHLAARGIKTLRFTNSQILDNFGRVLTTIRAAVKSLALPDRPRKSGRTTKPAEGSPSREHTGGSRRA